MHHNIIITDNAFNRIQFLAQRAGNSNLKLRIQISGGGCSGFSYNYTMTEDVKDEDTVFTKDSAHLLIDPTSLPFLVNSTVDFIEELGSAYFSIKNPNATVRCGCGNSFAV